MSERNVVITSTGAITPLGRTAEQTMAAAYAGEIGITYEREFIEGAINPDWLEPLHAKIDALANILPEEQRKQLLEIKDYIPGYQRLRSHVAGRIHGYDLLEDSDFPGLARRITRKDLPRQFSPAGILATRAAAETAIKGGIADEDLMPIGIDTDRYAVVLASGIGGASLLATRAVNLLLNKRPGSTDMFQLMPENPTIVVADLLQAEGPHALTPGACNSSNKAFATAMRLIQGNEADVVLTGGVEALNAYTVAIFEATSAAYEGTDIARASLPFNPKRAGAVISEGAVMFLFEEEEHAKKRGANILARVMGYGESGGPGNRTELSSKHMFRAVQLAIERSGRRSDMKDIYSPHATGTPRGDRGEVEVIRRVEGELEIGLDGRVSPTKGRYGHMLGNANAVALLEAVEILDRQELPPAVGSEEVEADLVGKVTSAKEPVKMEVNRVTVVGGGFGNQNGATVIELYED